VDSVAGTDKKSVLSKLVSLIKQWERNKTKMSLGSDERYEIRFESNMSLTSIAKIFNSSKINKSSPTTRLK